MIIQQTVADIAHGITQITKELKDKFSNSKVINIGITPIRDLKLRAEAKEINALLKSNADEKNVFFLDIGPQMVDSNGDQKPGLFKSDGVHPNAAGIQIWHQTMRPLFEKLYSE